MINVKDNYWIPSENYKYVSNGIAWCKGFYLGRKDNIENWHDTNDEPPEPEEPKSEDFIKCYDDKIS